MSTLVRALVSGTFAGIAASLALAACAKRENRSAAQPMNATSHWAYGDQAALLTNADLVHTGLGYGTHHMAAVLWACLFEYCRNRNEDHRPSAVLRDALIASATAAVIDYTITPHRFTPGWELVLSKRSMAAGYLAMAGGFVAAEYVLPNRQSGKNFLPKDPRHKEPGLTASPLKDMVASVYPTAGQSKASEPIRLGKHRHAYPS